MAQKLPSKELKKTLHIALFLLAILIGVQANAQSVLLPGDVVVVSVNADTNSIDFIPLIDIEEGTQIYFSNGHWDDSTQTLRGNEIKITFNNPVQAGTNLHVNSIDDERMKIEGNINFEGDTHRLFTYQEENGIYRFIFGLGWGKGPIWNTSEEQRTGSDIPVTLETNNHILLTLGEHSNYQYYIRNGASGTRSLLLNYVGDASHWRGNDKIPYPAFGTSFNLLLPPVILFENSVSTVLESDSVAILNVAIYGHDGSRLSVDVVFDSTRSIASPSDFGGFNQASVNFTGLVGDAVYEVRVPIIDDEEYEGRETGIFTLQNLPKGNFGDFLTHSLIVQDDEIPDVRIAKVVNTVDSPGYIEILNMEEIMVSLSGWSLTSKNETITFLDDVKLYPGDAIKWLDTSDIDENDTANNNTVYSELDNPLLQSNGGSVSLRDRQGKMISEVKYSRAHKPENRETQKEELIVEKKSTQDNYQREQENNQLVSTNIAVLKEAKPGYKAITDQDILNAISPEKELFIWNEELKVFEGVKSSSVTEENNSVIFGYFEADEIKQLADLDESIIVQTNTSENLSFSISATDKNENENIEGLEGLNLIVNNLEIPIPVHKFIELSKAAYPDIELNMVVYGIQQNDLDELIFVKLEPDEYIAPFAPFWVMLESSLEKTIFEIEREALRKEEDIIVEEDFQDVGEQGLIEIVVGSADHEKRLKLHFAEDQLVKQVKNLNAYQELHLPYQSFLNISFNQGDDYFSEIMLSSKISQILTLPVHYSTSESGTLNFKISKWEGIPADWEIQLEDKTTEKKYNLRKDFTFNFDHSVKNINEEDDSENTRSLTDYSVPNRFVIHVNPAVENNEISDEENEKPRDLELHQNFPNPFNPATTISFYLPESEDIKLSVFNIVGQPVAVMAEGRLSAGEHQFEWDATDKPSGMYIYQLEVGKSVMTRKMTLVK